MNAKVHADSHCSPCRYSVSAGWPCRLGRVGERVAIATCEDRPDLALAADSPELITHS